MRQRIPGVGAVRRAIGRAGVSQRIAAGVAVFVAVLLVNVGIIAWGLVQLDSTENVVRDSDIPAERALNTSFLSLVNEETGLRGYLLTDDTVFLQPLRQGRAADQQVAGELAANLGAGSPLERYESGYRSTVQAWRDGYESPQLALRPTAPISVVAQDAGRGKALFDAVRAAHSKFDAAIVDKVDADFASASTTRARIITLMLLSSGIGAALGAAVLAAAVFSVVRPLANLRQIARDLIERRPIRRTSRPRGPQEFREVHEAIVSAGVALQERDAALTHANSQLHSTNRELEDANRLKSDFLATMSHELRTPLNSILGFTSLLRGGVAGGISGTADDYLERVERNGRILLELINDVLDLSKLEAGRTTVRTGVVVIEPLARQVATNMQALAEAKGLTVEVSDRGVRTAALADPRALAQILTNLVGNAVKFTEAGSVRVVIGTPSPGRVGIEVIDTGSGIAKEDQAAIFEAFSQVGRGEDTQGGSGLGLAISSRLATLMGGGLTVESAPGEGSRFVVDLPAVEASPTLLAGDADRPLVLAVDDDYDALCLWRAQLERHGFSFAGVQTPSLALGAAVSLAPAVIVLDVVFPGSNGWELLDQLQREPRTATIPVLVVSMTDADGQATRRNVGFLQKPVAEEELIRELDRYRPVGVPA